MPHTWSVHSQRTWWFQAMSSQTILLTLGSYLMAWLIKQQWHGQFNWWVFVIQPIHGGI